MVRPFYGVYRLKQQSFLTAVLIFIKQKNCRYYKTVSLSLGVDNYMEIC